MHSPLVSIIVPLYNRAVLVKETITSVLDQTYPHWELLVVDDGSTDGSDEVVKTFAEKEVRIKLYYRHREPKGAPTCRNIGLEKSSGEYVIFMDSDDLLAPWCLEDRMKFFEVHKDLDFLAFNCLTFTEVPLDNNLLWNINDTFEDLDRMLLGDLSWQTSGPIWKKQSLINSQLYWQEGVQDWQDWEFHLRSLLCGLRYKKYLNMIDYFLRRNSKNDQISDKDSSYHRLPGRLKLFSMIRKILIGKGISLNLFNVFVLSLIEKKVREFKHEPSKVWGLLTLALREKLIDRKLFYLLILYKKVFFLFDFLRFKMGIKVLVRVFYLNIDKKKKGYRHGRLLHQLPSGELQKLVYRYQLHKRISA